MKKSIRFLTFVLGTILLTHTFTSARTTRRFVLATGANFGGHERETLRYAVSDAENFAQVLETMGGVSNNDQIILSDPSIEDFHQALNQLKTNVITAQKQAERTEIVVYYSGHADENGLRLGQNLLTYQTMRNIIDTIPADVHITVLDACASGAITRIKGGERQQAFAVGDASNMTGYAFMTSSSENEAAQESDIIGGSFFTHFLVSGLRGAADMSGDGRVTLGEAYHFAFQNTLARTVDTRGGVQHPNYDIKMTGTGDVIMTDVRSISAGLILAEKLTGRLFIRNANNQMVAELRKTNSQAIELGLEPGVYDIYFEQNGNMLHSVQSLKENQRLRISLKHFQTAELTQTTSRGNAPQTQFNPYLLAHRSRFELRKTGPYRTWAYIYWVNERVAMQTIFSGYNQNAASNTKAIINTRLAGIRYYLPGTTSQVRLKPYLDTALGLYTTQIETLPNSKKENAFGIKLGAGLDFHPLPNFMASVNGGYNWTKNVTLNTNVSPVKQNISNFQFGFGISLLTGKMFHTR